MVIERYNYLRCNTNQFHDNIKKEYRLILPTLINAVQTWWNSFPYSKKDWQVEANPKDGILIKSPRPFNSRPTYCPGYAENVICIPGELTPELEVGWQDYSYGSMEDPKKDIAMTLMRILKSEDRLKHIFDSGIENCIAADDIQFKCNRK